MRVRYSAWPARVVVILMAHVTGCIHFSPQTDSITETFFPDPDITIATPAFESDGAFTDHRSLLAYIDKTLEGHESVAKLSFIGKSQRGRVIPMVTLTATETPKIRIWFQGGLHGNEPASSEGLLLFLKHVLEESALRELLEIAEVSIVPVANVDGYEVQSRYADNGLDLNRDQTKLLAQESISLKRAYNDFAPDVAVDFHEYRPYRRDFMHFGTHGVTNRFDVMFLYSGNLNVPRHIRELNTSILVDRARHAVEERGLRSRDYFSTRKIHGEVQLNQGGVSARSSSTSFALSQAFSTLIEVRGVGLGRTSFKRRVDTTVTVAKSYLKSAAEHHAVLRAAINRAHDMATPVTVTSTRHREVQRVTMIDLVEEREMDIDVVVRDALRSIPTLERARPVAYVLLPQAASLVRKLEVLGLELVQTSEPREFTLEEYEVTDCIKDPFEYEGTQPQRVQTIVRPRSVLIPAGGWLLDLKQRRANLAVEVLEPEASNSFVSFGLVDAEVGQRLPYFRLMQPADQVSNSVDSTQGGGE